MMEDKIVKSVIKSVLSALELQITVLNVMELIEVQPSLTAIV